MAHREVDGLHRAKVNLGAGGFVEERQVTQVLAARLSVGVAGSQGWDTS
jgi:hypothetical protein